MANPEHVAIVKEGVEVLNQWREEKLGMRLDLIDADLSNVGLSNANLIDADLRHANLRNADLMEADLTHANLGHADLSHCNLIGANLWDADLSYANLSDANLSDADLRHANLHCANLIHAGLISTQAVYAIFKGAAITGACIQDWNINSQTNLSNIECEYIFLNFDEHYNKYSERRPSSGNFAPGDFGKLVQKSISTVDLIFRNGINWEAFAYSFQTLQIQAGSDELDVQAIENKGDGDFVIRVNAPIGADKAKIQEFVMEEYGKELKAIESKYQAQLELKGEQLAFYQEQLTLQRQDNTRLIGVVEKMAEKDTNVTNLTIKNLAGSINTGSGSANASNFSQTVTTSEKQELAEVATEMQRLLKQLAETNPTATAADQKRFVSAGLTPTKNQRLVSALKAGGQTTIEEFLDNAYVNVAIAIIQGWQEAE